MLKLGKNLLQSPYFLAPLMVLLLFALSLAALYLVQVFPGSQLSMVTAAAFVAPYIIGQMYSSNFEELMSRKLRLQVTALYITLLYVLLAAYVIWFRVSNLSWYLFTIALFHILYFVVTYWTLRLGSWMQMRSLRKKQRKQKKN